MTTTAIRNAYHDLRTCEGMCRGESRYGWLVKLSSAHMTSEFYCDECVWSMRKIVQAIDSERNI